MPEQPGPDRSLVIAAIAIADAAVVVAAIFWVVRCQRPQTERGEQRLPALFEHAALHSRIERRGWQADGKELVRPHGRVAAFRSVDHIEQAITAGLQKALKAEPCAFGYR